MNASVFHCILAAVDLGPGSRHVIAAAARLAQPSGAQLTLLHVLDYEPTFDGGVPLLAPNEERAALAAAAYARLSELAAQAGAPDARICVARGYPKREIAETARRLGADLVVVGSWRTRWASWIKERIDRLRNRSWEVLRV